MRQGNGEYWLLLTIIRTTSFQNPPPPCSGLQVPRSAKASQGKLSDELDQVITLTPKLIGDLSYN